MASYELARQAFEEYAGMDAPRLPANHMSALQVRLGRWQTRNFGGASDLELAAGIGEEVGELLEAWHGTDVIGDAELDAAADIAIYSINLCTNLRLDYGTIPAVKTYWVASDAPIWSGKLLHACLKHSQRIRGFESNGFYREKCYEAIARLKGVCDLVCRTSGESFDQVLNRVAEQVMKREWRKAE